MDEFFHLPWHLIGRILLAGGLGALFGLERDLHGKAAGLRTSMLISMGSCLFTIISVHGFDGNMTGFDPSRIASQIVVGVGFIGAGVLLKNDHKVLGLTTASNVWLMAAIGMAVGTGLWQLAVATAIIGILILTFLGPISYKVGEYGEKRMKAKGHEVVEEL